MGYMNGLPVGYQQMMQQQYMQNNQQTGLIWVQGEAAAKSYLLAPGCTVPLWDSEEKVIYLKSADASGMPSMKVLDYQIRGEAGQEKKEEYATKADLDALAEKVAALARKKTMKVIREDEDDE